MNLIRIANLNTLENLLKGNYYSKETTDSGIYYCDSPHEMLIINPDNLRPFRKVPEITYSIILNDIKLLEVISNRYIPIVNKNTGSIVFNIDDFNEYRKKMSGIKEYGSNDYVFSDNLYFSELDYYLEKIDSNIETVNRYRTPIIKEITRLLNSIGLTVGIGSKAETDVQLLEAGSTSRGTNIPNDDGSKWDFDFTVRFNPELTWKVKDILEKMDATRHITKTSRYKVRLIDVLIPGLNEKVDLDFSLTPQKEEYLSTEEALEDRLDTIRTQDLEKYRLVIANIMYAKDILKKGGAYKPSRGIIDGDRRNGGLGGVGIENWILQNGGSFIDASKSFMEAAKGKDFIEFEQTYSIFDFGCNHVGKAKGIWPYDNFVVNNMRYLGYNNMKEILTKFLDKTIDNSIKK